MSGIWSFYFKGGMVKDTLGQADSFFNKFFFCEISVKPLIS